GAHHGEGLVGRQRSHKRFAKEISSVLAVGQREFRIQRNGLLVAFLSTLWTRDSLIMPRLQQSLISGQARLVLLKRRGRSGKLHPQRGRNGLRDLVLHSEYIRQLAVIALRPEMRAVLGVDELRRHSDAASGTAYAAFEDGAHAECFGDLGDVLLF